MVQTVEQSDDEKMIMYLKLPKEEIIKMLIESNKILFGRKPFIVGETYTLEQVTEAIKLGKLNPNTPPEKLIQLIQLIQQKSG